MEALNEQLTPEELELFHDLARNKHKGIKPKPIQLQIKKLKIKIKEIKDKLLKQMTEFEQYEKLKTLEEKLNFFNQYGEVQLTPDELNTLKELYKVYFSKFQALNTSCSACIREMLNVCISRYSALKKQFDAIAPVEEKSTTEEVKSSKTKKGKSE